jgi:putative Holliday junction resolvase
MKAAVRILGLDVGTKRIGVALSDELGWTAQPLETFVRRSLEVDLQHIRTLVSDYEVAEIVVGLPLDLRGRAGPAAQGVKQFVEAIRTVVGIPVVEWDERFTTRAAQQVLVESGLRRRKRKKLVDRIAASILLQSYLEARSYAGSALSDFP